MSALCGVCGTYLPPSGGCAGCGAVRGKTQQKPDTELLLVGIRCTFPCRACGFASPLDALVGNGDAVCLKCGMHQTFPIDAWNETLPALHGMADLGSPDADERRGDRVWAIGPTALDALRNDPVKTLNSGPLTTRASLGHPLCDTCSTPVHIAIEDLGMLRTSCPGCGEHAQYACQPAQFSSPANLRGVLGVEHRIDRAEAKRDSDQFLCSSCAAPLAVDGLGRLVRCEFCQAVSRIPVEQLQGLASPPPPDLWWMVFEGPSATRHAALTEPEDPTPIESASTENGTLNTLWVLTSTTLAVGLGTALAIAAWLLR